MHRIFLLATLLALVSHAAAQPLTLSQALARSEQTSPVQSAKLAARLAKQQLERVSPLQVSLSGTAATAPKEMGGQSAALGLHASLGVLPWAGHSVAVARAERQWKMAQVKLRETLREGQSQVAQAYFGVLLAEKELALAEQTLKLRERQHWIGEQQRTQENLSAEQLAGLALASEQAKAHFAGAQQALDYARRSLQLVLGMTTEEALNIQLTSMPPRLPLPPLAEAIGEKTIEVSSEWLTAQDNVANARETLAEARRAVQPDLNAKIHYGKTGAGLNAQFDYKRGQVTANYLLPLEKNTTPVYFDASVSGTYLLYSPAEYAAISAAEVALTQAQWTLNITEQKSRLEYRNRRNNAQRDEQTAAAAEAQKELSMLAVETARARMKAGIASADEVTQAELNLLEAERNLLSAQIKAYLSVLPLLPTPSSLPAF